MPTPLVIPLRKAQAQVLGMVIREIFALDVDIYDILWKNALWFLLAYNNNIGGKEQNQACVNKNLKREFCIAV